MKKKILKIACLLILLTFMISYFSGNVYAGLGDISSNSYSDWKYDNSQSVITSTQNVMATAITVVQTVTLGIAVIMLLMIAIKYMSASPEGKAEYKKSATAYVVGAVVMFGVSGILSIIKTFAQNIK